MLSLENAEDDADTMQGRGRGLAPMERPRRHRRAHVSTPQRAHGLVLDGGQVLLFPTLLATPLPMATTSSTAGSHFDHRLAAIGTDTDEQEAGSALDLIDLLGIQSEDEQRIDHNAAHMGETLGSSGVKDVDEDDDNDDGLLNAYLSTTAVNRVLADEELYCVDNGNAVYSDQFHDKLQPSMYASTPVSPLSALSLSLLAANDASALDENASPDAEITVIPSSSSSSIVAHARANSNGAAAATTTGSSVFASDNRIVSSPSLGQPRARRLSSFAYNIDDLLTWSEDDEGRIDNGLGEDDGHMPSYFSSPMTRHSSPCRLSSSLSSMRSCELLAAQSPPRHLFRQGMSSSPSRSISSLHLSPARVRLRTPSPLRRSMVALSRSSSPMSMPPLPQLPLRQAHAAVRGYTQSWSFWMDFFQGSSIASESSVSHTAQGLAQLLLEQPSPDTDCRVWPSFCVRDSMHWRSRRPPPLFAPELIVMRW